MAPLEGFALNHLFEMFVQPGSILLCLHNVCDASAVLGG